MRWIVRIVLVLLLAVQAWRAVRATRVEALLETANTAYDDGDGPVALEAVKQALAIDDGPQAVWSWLGDTAAYVYRHPPAEGRPKAESDALAQLMWKGYAGAVLRCPVDSWSWSGLGEAAQREARRGDEAQAIGLEEIDRRGGGILNGKFAVALAAADIAVKLQPSGYPQLDGLARIYEVTGEVDKARETYVLSARMMPAPSAHAWGSGRRLYRALYDAILGGLREGLAQAPRFERSSLCLDIARFVRAHGELDTALEFLRAARQAADHPYWRFQCAWEMAGVLEESAHFPEAIEELRTAYALGMDRSAVTRRLGSIEMRLGRFPDACAHLSSAARDDEDDVGLSGEASRACEQAGEIDLAAELLEYAADDPTEDLVVARALLDFYRRVGRDRTAVGLLRAWRRDYPDQKEFENWANEAGVPATP